jgi:hypothetical protein
MTDYPVISGQLNLGGPFFFGNWGATDTFVLCNGTQVFLSGTSGFVASSYYWGKNAGSTAYAASLVTNRTNDVRPYMIVGVKYPDNYDRTLIWSSEHTAQLYETNIQLAEPVTHFKEIQVLGSGFENGGVGCRHASKNVYNTQPRIMGCDAWAYTPWKLAEKHNLVIGQEMRLSGNSGHIGSGYFMGMGNQTTAYAAGKWNTDYQFSATAPYAIFGVDRKPVLNLNLINGEHGIISADTSSGCEYDYVNLEATPNEGWYFSGYSISGAQLTGNQFRFNNSDVTVEGGWTDQGYPITYLSDEHVQCTGDTTIYIPGGTGITLQTGYDTYYRISGYEVENGTVENGILIPTGPCTIKAVEKINYFTATGGWEKGSNVQASITNYNSNTKTVATKYATHGAHTGDIPASWYSTSNRWKPNNVSSYSITLHPIMVFQYNSTITSNANNKQCTAISLIGSTTTQSQSFSKNGKTLGIGSFTYNKTFTSTTQNVNYGISAKLYVSNGYNGNPVTVTYSAAKTTGTWTATGIAP